MQNAATKKTASARSAFVSAIIGLFIFACAVWGWYMWPRQFTGDVRFGDTTIHARYALTADQQISGLSGASGLSADQGMLFVFPTNGTYKMWMKDMRFAIDIIWLDSDKKVITVQEDVTPSTYPRLFAPPEPVRYALEVPAGAAKSAKITIGDTATFTAPTQAK